MRTTVTLLLTLALSGCSWFSWFGKSDEQIELETGSSETTTIPEGLDEPGFVDLMPIPNVDDYRGLAGQPYEVGLPQALSTSFGVDTIVIRRLGDDRWVFVDLPVATIWPQVVLFFEENQLPVAVLDPRNGVLETEWIVGESGNPDEIYESLSRGTNWSNTDSLQQYRFRVTVEPGVRNGSTEIFLEQIERRFGESRDVAWQGESDNPELEGKVLSSIAYFIGGRTAEGPTVSLLAAGLQESKASLVTESGNMVLKYRLTFDRAWATVGAALENARVNVKDLDRSSAVYYVRYSSGHEPEPGFFSRIIGIYSDDDESADGYDFQVQLASEGEEVHVTVAGEGQAENLALSDTESLILRERLLKLIKEYST